ncbi:MAG TPA: tetratricopeptide repeat protein [Bacteroidales bacterium]|nr:tetratricopeptide repeat protein [Bacteroidales bacterium]
MSPDLLAQSRLEIKKIFYDAESWILFEDYKEALPLYQQLLRIYPTNSNYKYRVGQCYINTPGEKEKSISYLEDAVKNINPDYKEGKFKETRAPYDALYYLANAYRINNQIDKALQTYQLFRKNMDANVYDSNIVNLQIQSCLNATELMNQPLFIREKNLSNQINESNSEFNPVVTDNEDMIIFARSEPFYDAIMYSTRTSSGWNGPYNMNELLKVDRDLFPTSISKDGKTLYLYSSADYDGIIYSSTFENGTWQPIVKLNDNINTKYWESHATISHDNKKLFFTSNRKGTYGGLDIYMSKRDSTGDWGPAENLGPVINTPYNEESPFLSQDDRVLFFSSRGHFNMGGYDVFYSTFLPDGTMSVPLNAGYPLNTTDDDVFFKPVKDGFEGYLAKEDKNGYGKQDIYRIEIFSDDHPRKFLVRGMVKVADLMSNFNDSVRISAMNIKNPNQTLVVYSDPVTGEYSFELPQGKYQVTYESGNSTKITKDLDLAIDYPVDSFVMPGTILPKTDFIADLNVGNSKTITVSTGDSLLFPLSVEPNSLLKIEHWAGDSLLYTEEFTVRDSIFNFKMAPGPGDSKIVFKLTDKFSNTTTTEVFITREKETPLVRPEYSHIIARKQVAAFISMLKSRSGDDLKKIINGSDLEKHQFGNIDDVISTLKEEAIKKNISAEEIDKLALRIAVMDNVLTQAAVDYLAKNTDGQLKRILEELNIYKENLKTWTDLQEYISARTNGEITPEELNEIASLILSETDLEIPSIREKILAYSNYSESGEIIKESIKAVDISNIKLKGKWLGSFYSESLKRGLTSGQMAKLLVSIGSLPGTDVKQFLDDLMNYSEEPLLSSLKELDLKKNRLRTPEELISFLLTNSDTLKYPQNLIYNALASMIRDKNIPESAIAEQVKGKVKKFPWLIVIISGLILIFIIIAARRKKDKKKEE